MYIKIETENYNEKRYGKPYIALCDNESVKVIKWGDWFGTPGHQGDLTIEAEPGDIVMKGQKDYRNSKNSAPSYHIV